MHTPYEYHKIGKYIETGRLEIWAIKYKDKTAVSQLRSSLAI